MPQKGTPVKLQRNGRSKALAIGAMALVSSLSLAACGSDDNNTTATGSGGSSSAAPAIDCGPKQAPWCLPASTAQGNAIDILKNNFGAACKDTTINYGGGGSGAGVQQFNQGKIQFAGSDSALKPAEVDASKAVCTGGQGINLPVVAGLISIVYNVEGVDNLVLDGPTIAKIFDSQITKWNDPAIVALNPSAKLPDADIQAFHRTDDSGTTENLTKYFAKTSAGAWSYPASKAWAGKGGQGASGSAGVSAQVKQVKNSVSYAELSFAQTNNLKSASINTGAAKPVEATAVNAANTFAKAQIMRHRQRPGADPRLRDQGRGLLPAGPGHLRDRLRQGQQGRHAGRPQGLPDLLHQRRGPEGDRRRGLRPAAEGADRQGHRRGQGPRLIQ